MAREDQSEVATNLVQVTIEVEDNQLDSSGRRRRSPPPMLSPIHKFWLCTAHAIDLSCITAGVCL